MAERPREAETVIIGGGVIGLSVAYHLSNLGANDVILLERNQLTSGTSWHAAGIVGPLRASFNLTQLSVYATELFEALEAETGQATGYRRTGGLWLAQTNDRLTELKRIAAMGDITGLHAEILNPAEAAARSPMLDVAGLTGALWVEEDGQANPVDVCMAYAKGARSGGVRIFEDTGVAGVMIKEGAVAGVELTSGETIRCKRVVNCAGAWACDLAKASGVTLPLQAVEHMYVVTEPVEGLGQPFPIVRDLESRTYFKEDAGKLVVGWFEHNAKVWRPDANGPDAPFLELPEDWAQAEPYMEAAMARMPVLERTGIQHFMVGPESFTPDTRQAMGEAPEVRNYFVAAGFNSIGIVSSAGAGKMLAEWIVGDEPPMDLWEVDVARFEPHHGERAFLEARVAEAVSNQFAMHWPFKQMTTGRDLKQSAFHEGLVARGAVMGAPTGWERPLYFAAGDERQEMAYSYGDQTWWPPAEREARTLVDAVSLIELSPFAKFDVSGEDAPAFLQRLCANDVGVDPGRLVYTQMLNTRGGIEADVTVTRIAEDRFRVVSGAATRRRDLARISRAVEPGERVEIADVTDDLAVLGVMGPEARTLLSRLSDDDVSNDTFPFGRSREIALADSSVRASRVSYVGELGWELYVPVDQAAAVHAALWKAGQALSVGHMGLFAVDCCRMEKGYRHWGHDIGPDDTPLEAGLGFAVAWDKPGGFIGLDALARQWETGVTCRLAQFSLGDAHPLVLHDEPIYCRGAIVGRTTSGARGFRTGQTLCLATIACEAGESLDDLLAREYEIAVAGERFPLTPQKRPPYDPGGARMRG